MPERTALKATNRARVAVGVHRDRPKGLVPDRDALAAEAAVRIAERPLEDRRHFVDSETVQDEDFRPRQERRVDFE